MLNLTPAIHEIQKELDKITAKHRAEIKPYDDSLEHLMKINEACLVCGGTGKVFKRSCAEDEGDYYKCGGCNGTGRKKQNAVD